MMRCFSARVTAPRSGQAVAEFSLMLLPLIILIYGVIEVGRGVWYYNQLSQLAREGARWLIVTTADSSTAYQLPGNVRGTYQVATCGCGAETAVGWVSRQEIGIPRDQLKARIYYWESPNSVMPIPPRLTWGVPVTVELEYPYQPLISGVLNIPATIPLKAQTTMHFQ